MMSNDLHELEMQLSILQCKEHFTDEDYDLQANLMDRINTLKTCRKRNLVECLKKIDKGILTKEAHDQLVKVLKETYTAEEIEKARAFINV